MNKYMRVLGVLFLIGACGIVAQDVFVGKSMKKQSNSKIKERIVHAIKELMRECNSLIRTICVKHDFLIAQIEDVVESQNFFAQADNEELISCEEKLKELCARLKKTCLEIDQTMAQAFKSRKK